MREAFSHNQKITLNQDPPKKEEQKKQQQKKTPLKKETIEKLAKLGIDVTKIKSEEEAIEILEKKITEKKPPKRNKKEQIEFEAQTLATNLNVPTTESMGTKAILDAIKQKIQSLKTDAGNNLEKMAEALSFEVSYKAILGEFETYNNATSGMGVASLADYNRFRLGL